MTRSGAPAKFQSEAVWMIKVLNNWKEIGEATKFLGRQRLPGHQASEKNWDLYHLYELAASLPRESRILDMGCGGGYTLRFLAGLGFENLWGLDLRITFLDRLKQLRHMRQNKMRRPLYRLRRGDITRTFYKDSSFDLLTCVSVIEHGVDMEALVQESARLLKPGGWLYLTTDYWETEVADRENFAAFGLPWHIFSRGDIERLLEKARTAGLSEEEVSIPACSERCIVWNRQEYTFLALGLRKQQ